MNPQCHKIGKIIAHFQKPKNLNHHHHIPNNDRSIFIHSISRQIQGNCSTTTTTKKHTYTNHSSMQTNRNVIHIIISSLLHHHDDENEKESNCSGTKQKIFSNFLLSLSLSLWLLSSSSLSLLWVYIVFTFLVKSYKKND